MKHNSKKDSIKIIKWAFEGFIICVLIAVFYLLVSCTPEQVDHRAYVQAAVEPGCFGLDPTHMLVKIDDYVIVLEVDTISGGLITEKFTLPDGEYNISSIEVFNDEGIRTHFVAPNHLHSKRAAMWVPFKQKINQDVQRIAAQLFCN